MNPVIVKNCRIGEGRVKIIVPIVGVTQQAILAEAATFHDIPVDVVEWRIDWYEDGCCAQKVIETAALLQQTLGDIPLLCTFRTSKEGGERAIEPQAYAQLLKDVCASGTVDMIDVEIFTGDAIVADVIAAAHAAGVKVIASNHDFHKTPSRSDIVYRLRKMQDMGADIPKIAVMPQSKKDVLTLLAATEEVRRLHTTGPTLTMAMGREGSITRLAGEYFGSDITFCSLAKSSAPGQVDVRLARTIMDELHSILA